MNPIISLQDIKSEATIMITKLAKSRSDIDEAILVLQRAVEKVDSAPSPLAPAEGDVLDLHFALAEVALAVDSPTEILSQIVGAIREIDNGLRTAEFNQAIADASEHLGTQLKEIDQFLVESRAVLEEK